MHVGSPWLAGSLAWPGLLHKCFTVSPDLNLSYFGREYL